MAPRAYSRPYAYGAGTAGRAFGPRVIGPRVIVSPFRFARPFYAFRPRFSIGVGLWVGFPISYPYYYDSPYYYGAYPYPPYPYTPPYTPPYVSYPPSPYPDSDYYRDDGGAYRYPTAPSSPAPYSTEQYPAPQYPPSGSVATQPGRDSGGLSFEITPTTARVFVDGIEVGTVAEFSPTNMPLTLTLGRHHVDLRAAGYHTMSFDAEITAGQVIPYRGELERWN